MLLKVNEGLLMKCFTRRVSQKRTLRKLKSHQFIRVRDLLASFIYEQLFYRVFSKIETHLEKIEHPADKIFKIIQIPQYWKQSYTRKLNLSDLCIIYLQVSDKQMILFFS
jgi:hypothetical protein